MHIFGLFNLKIIKTSAELNPSANVRTFEQSNIKNRVKKVNNLNVLPVISIILSGHKLTLI